MGFSLHFIIATCIVTVSSIVLEVPGYAKIKGVQSISSYNHRRYFSFHNLPYAKQPTNLTRFLPPVPVEPFPAGETIDGVSLRFGCPQNRFSTVIGTEDCLIVDVHTPKLPGDASDPNVKYDNLLPVIYWIHGGLFSVGGNLEYIPNKYMSQDIVLVQVQYRLGPLVDVFAKYDHWFYWNGTGFLTLNTDEVPGNAGIFDQIEGLRWVQKHIKYFGGDPNCVTIVGESAGSASVSLLLLAPQARGLFHRVIGESGSTLPEWALDRDPKVAEEPCRRIAELAGCPLEPYKDLLHCLRNIPAEELTAAFAAFVDEDRYNGGMGFGGSNPVIQTAGAQRIIETDPQTIMESGNYSKDVPIMFGANKQEGVIILTESYNSYLKPHNYHNDPEYLKHQIMPDLLKTFKISDETGTLAEALTSKYLSKAEPGNFTSMLPGLVDFCSVAFIKSGGYETVQLHSRNNPNSYWYSFEFEGRNTLYYIGYHSGKALPFPPGVSHMDELIYLFEYPFFLPFNATERLLSERMLKIWTTFAKYGDPTPDGVSIEGVPKFPQYNLNDEFYMAIDDEWTIKQDYTKQYTVTIDSQTYDDSTIRKRKPILRDMRHFVNN